MNNKSQPFLSNELEEQMDNAGHEILISGVFDDPVQVVSTAGNDIPHLKAEHKEADIYIFLHAADTTNKR